MAFNNYMIRIAFRLVLIFLSMLVLVVIIGQQGRLFSVIGVSFVLFLLIAELFQKIARTNRVIESLLESIRYGDYNKKIQEKTAGLGFKDLADSAQKIIRAIASAKIEKETQYQYLQMILDHIQPAVLTLNEQKKVELINPPALTMLGLYNKRKPAWEDIAKSVPIFAEVVDHMGPSGREMIRLSNTPMGKKLLILVSTVKIGNKPVRIVTFQDIEPEIDQKEMESWQTISRIMAHEIMNSLTPLSSLTETGIMLLEEKGRTKDLKELTQQTIDNLYTALKTISDRNLALTQFIGNYRQLSRLPLPNKKKVYISALLTELKELYELPFKEKGIQLDILTGPAKQMIHADDTQVKQVLINLIKNAMEVLEGLPDPGLKISSKRIMDNIVIEVKDNGPGIPADLVEKIFVPFFSTKPEGSGIGLSLSKQIIRNHNGQINVESDSGSGTTFKVILPVE